MKHGVLSFTIVDYRSLSQRSAAVVEMPLNSIALYMPCELASVRGGAENAGP